MWLNCFTVMIKLLMDEELSLMGEQRNWFVQTESAPGEDAVKVVEITIKALGY